MKKAKSLHTQMYSVGLFYTRSLGWYIVHFNVYLTTKKPDTYFTINTVNHVLSAHSKIDKTKVLMTNNSLMKVDIITKGEHSAILLACIKQ